MPNEEKQISDLTTGSITNNNDVFIMDTYEGVTVKIPYSVLRSAIANAITPSINATSKNWYIGSTDTGVVAEGQNGDDDYSISATVTTITGGHRVTISHTDTSIADQTFDVMDGTEIIQTTSDNRQVTLTSYGWVGDSAPYTQSVTILGMTSSVVPIISPLFSDTIATALEQKTEWAKITKAVSDTNSIIFKCYEEKPTIELTAIIKVV